MGDRHEARKLAVQVLFHLEFTPAMDPEEALRVICANFGVQEKAVPFAGSLVMGVYERRKELDRMISHASKNWRIERMPCVDRCILRLATFEMTGAKDVPPKVSIDEAVELAKQFGTQDSPGFINGVLDNIYNSLPDADRAAETENRQQTL